MKEIGLSYTLAKLGRAVDVGPGIHAKERIRRTFLQQVFERVEAARELRSFLSRDDARLYMDQVGWKPNPNGRETVFGIILVGDSKKEAIIYAETGSVEFVKNGGENVGLQLVPLAQFEAKHMYDAGGLLATMTEAELLAGISQKLDVVAAKIPKKA